MNKSYIQKITPFIDNMRVQAEEGGEPEPQKTIPFANGDILNSSTKIHFDTTKGDDLIAALESMDWTPYEEMGGIPILAEFGKAIILMAARIPKEDPTQYMYYIMAGSGEGMSGLMFISEDLYVEGTLVAEKGFHNLDANGDVTLNENEGTPGYIPKNALPVTIDMLIDTTPASWNGIIIGTQE